MPEDVQSRYRVLERPTESPGQCIVCGATDRPVVDFGVDVEWADMGYGRAYFCEFCIKQAASKFPDTDRDTYNAQVVKEAVLDYRDELTRAVHGVLVNFNPGFFLPSSSNPPVAEPEIEPVKYVESVPDISNYDSSASGSDSEAVSDDSGERPASVSGNTGDERPRPEPFRLEL